MGLPYFKGLTWDCITREERAFCAELYFQARSDPERFVRLLVDKAKVSAALRGPWDVAYEVCFYRDYFHCFARDRKKSFSPKRTFDLALFGDDAIIVIEAKAAETFTVEQSRSFEADLEALSRVEGLPPVHFVALGSGTYFSNYRKLARGTALQFFDERWLSWEEVAAAYPGVPLLKRACEVYVRRPLGSSPSMPNS